MRTDVLREYATTGTGHLAMHTQHDLSLIIRGWFVAVASLTNPLPTLFC
jgi:hypothetical protein